MGVQNKQKLIAKSKASYANKLSCHAFDLFSAQKNMDFFASHLIDWLSLLHDDSTRDLQTNYKIDL